MRRGEGELKEGEGRGPSKANENMTLLIKLQTELCFVAAWR